ncbi:hypothetical protein DY000_02063542 [Brassica cretica]|uniref:Uncharacterized protein n=1 Tax=Brassica cretica TaxID=69181 RepID=A0ABQ7AYL7_BRACR|nr:hypothetical protein DY000_02063542 [Brassica cretica]
MLGILVLLLRILTKAVYPQDPDGLRKCVNLYFAVGIVVMVICAVSYNVAYTLPVIKFREERKAQALLKESQENGSLTGLEENILADRDEDQLLGYWFPVLLMAAAFNVFDLVGKSLTAVFMLVDEKTAVGGCIARLFYSLFWGCLHGPMFLRTEIPVAILTCLLGLTNGYLTSVLMILAPKSVPLKHSETAGIVSALFLVIGLAASGSVLAWFWVIWF